MANAFADTIVSNDISIMNQNERQFDVFVHNDDYTPIEVVILVLVEVFNKAPEDAVELTLEVNKSDKGLVGTYDMKTAYELYNQACALVDEIGKFFAPHPIPLTFTVEEH